MVSGHANALLPAPETRLNEREVERPTKRKRKAGDDDGAFELAKDIIAHPFELENGRQRIFKPRRLIARSALPLAYIRGPYQQSPVNGLPLFTAHIWALERDDSDTEEEGSVLIVEDTQHETLAAIERVEKGVYAICRLVDWVSLDDFTRQAIKRPRLHLQQRPPIDGQGSWWQSASVQPALLKESIKPVKKLHDLVLSKRPVNQNTEPLAKDKAMDNAAAASAAPSDAPKQTVPTNETTSQSSDAITSLRSHYLETLYISRAPLAYFAKGPLSRARFAYQERNMTTTSPISDDFDLPSLLQSSVLPVKAKGNNATIDKKYATAIVDLIREIPPGTSIDDETDQLKTLFGERIRKSRKRKKPTTDGLVPGEEDYLIRWWIARESSLPQEGSEDSREKRIRNATSELKARELQLQIILILELLALQSQFTKADDARDIDASKDNDSQSQPVSIKQKKSRDFVHVMEVLIEKLQIWETTSQGLGFAIEGGLDSRARNKGAQEGEGNDCLKNFCSDIVIPFYTSRIPEVTRNVCHKLGIIVSPPKRQIARTVSAGRIGNRPGAAIKDGSKTLPRKTLERVLTDERLASRKLAPSLSRSATDSVLPAIKQEFEDVKMSSIPLYRQSIEQSKLYARREVDLTAEAKATHAKLNRKIAVEQELKGAIDALKKPNARLAVKEFMDASDERISNKKAKPRKSQNPTRNPFATGVQVTATPRANRHRPMKSMPLAPSQIRSEVQEPDFIAPSSDLNVPSSSIRPSTSLLPKKQATIMTTPKKCLDLPTALHPSVEATPSRRASKQSQRSQLTAMIEVDEDEVDELGSPDLPRLMPQIDSFKRLGLPRSEQRDSTPGEPLLSTLSKPRRATIATEVRIDRNGVGFTPVEEAAASKRNAPTAVPQSSPPKGPSMSEACFLNEEPRKDPKEENSIYAALGWDNDFDDIV